MDSLGKSSRDKHLPKQLDFLKIPSFNWYFGLIWWRDSWDTVAEYNCMIFEADRLKWGQGGGVSWELPNFEKFCNGKTCLLILVQPNRLVRVLRIFLEESFLQTRRLNFRTGKKRCLQLTLWRMLGHLYRFLFLFSFSFTRWWCILRQKRSYLSKIHFFMLAYV